jgi:putative transposase
MPRKTYKLEEIVGILWNIEILQGQGESAADCCREKGISEAAYYRWKKSYGGMHPSEAKRLKELEKENGHLKKLLAEVMLDNQILKDINSGNM